MPLEFAKESCSSADSASVGLELCLRSCIRLPADGAGPGVHTLCNQEALSSSPSLAAGPLREGR